MFKNKLDKFLKHAIKMKHSDHFDAVKPVLGVITALLPADVYLIVQKPPCFLLVHRLQSVGV